MSLLGFVILFIAAMNYVLISVSSLASRAKAIGVHKCSGASSKNIFSMFLWETSIIILVSLILVGSLVLNFDEQIEDIASASLSSLLHGELSGYLFVLFWFCFYLPVSFPDIYFPLFLSLRCSDVILKGGEVGNGLCFLYSLPG